MSSEPLSEPHGELVALNEDIQPQFYILKADTCILGRAPGCDMVVPSKTVSRQHAQVERHGPRYVLRDMGSINGTFVNGSQINAPHLLTDRDQIGLGDMVPVLRFIDPDPTVNRSPQLQYNENLMAFFLGQHQLDLSPAQLKLLNHLYQHAGEVCTRESCANVLWGRDYDPGLDADALDRTVSGLRSRLRQVDPKIEWIQTRRKAGYILHIPSIEME